MYRGSFFQRRFSQFFSPEEIHAPENPAKMTSHRTCTCKKTVCSVQVRARETERAIDEVKVVTARSTTEKTLRLEMTSSLQFLFLGILLKLLPCNVYDSVHICAKF